MIASAVQMDVVQGEIGPNLQRVISFLRDAAAGGAKLVVFPECALSGYCFSSLDEALPFGVEAGDDPLLTFAAECQKLGVVGVLGFMERVDRSLYNSALIVGERTSVYRKTHLPTLGVDRFTLRGDDLSVVHEREFTLGTLICYDVRFAEAVRCIGLAGTDVLALPTNWPEGAESSPEFLTRARAWENRMWIIAANRVGVERGRRFIGRSQIVSPSGVIVQEAGSSEETILMWDLDLEEARRKRIVIEAGEWEIDTTGDRRPQLYGRLTMDNG